MNSPRILLVKLSSLGDVIHALPALHALRRRWPKAYIAWIVEEKARDILFENPDLDEVIVIRTKRWRRRPWASWSEAAQILRDLRARHFDYALDIQGLIKSGVIARLSGAPLRAGFAPQDCREPLNRLFINRHAPFFGAEAHMVEKNLAALRALGVDAADAPREFPLRVPAAAEDYIAAFWRAHPELASAPLVAVNPGAGFETKEWPLERFAALADRIAAELQARVLLTWGPAEKEKAGLIAARMTRPSQLAPPTTVPQSIALYRRLALFAGLDTGPLHLCAALGVPTVSIFGPTDPRRNGAYGPGHTAVCKPLPCSFCYKRKCPTQNECMRDVTVEEVFAAVAKSFYNKTRTNPLHMEKRG